MRRKMIFSYIAVLLLFAGFIFVFVLQTLYTMVRDNLMETSGQAMTQRSSELASVMQFGRTHILNLATNEQLQETLRKQITADSGIGNSPNADAVSEQLERNGLLKKVMYTNSVTLKNMPFLAEISYRATDGSYVPIYYANRQNSGTHERYSPTDPWIIALEQRKGRFLWSTYEDQSNEFLRLSKIIYDTNDYSRQIGIISLDLSYGHLAQSVLYQLRTQSGIDAALVNCSTGQTIGYNTVTIPPSVATSLHQDKSILINNNNDCLFVRSLSNTNYCLVGLKSLDEVHATYLRSIYILIAAACAALILGMIAALILSRKITKPIVELSHIMQDVQNGDLDITVHTAEKGEIGELYHSFNYMIQMINTLIEESYVTRLNQKQSELNALQSQINTHFLYNTLDSINWLAKDYHAQDISYLVTNLSTLLRTSLNNGSPELCIEQELCHARCYINIQQVRFGGLFTVQEEVDPVILNDKVIKMLLQPLVENAILHSFHRIDSVPDENKLILCATCENDDLLLSVCNNARPENLVEIESRLRCNPGELSKSYGIQSIKNRLTIAYGGAADYRYSIDAQGMLTATIRIPRRFTKQERKETPDTGEI